MAIRVLFLITDLQIGGSPRVVRDLAIRLRSSEIETTVACLSSWGPVADELKSAGITVHALGATRTTQLPRVVRAFRKLAGDVDVVFSFLVHANAVAAMALRSLPNVRLIESIQTTQSRPRWHWPVQRWAAGRAERIVLPSPSVAAIAIDRARIPAGHMTVIPNAIDVDAFANLRLPELSARYRVGFIGRLDPIKRVNDLIDAATRSPEIDLHLFGDGKERDRLMAQARRLSIIDRVHFHGVVSSSRDALPLIDVLVLPSDAEGFGLVLIEAMAAGVPVIATNVPGIRDVVTHEKTGLLIAARSPMQIADAIERMRSDVNLRERLIATASEYVRNTYTWERVLPAYRKILLGDENSPQTAVRGFS